MVMLYWEHISGVDSHAYICGHCGNAIASEKGWKAKDHPTGNVVAAIYICHRCTKPTFFDANKAQTPGVTFGEAVKDIPDSAVEELYNEARRTTGTAAYTAAVL